MIKPSLCALCVHLGSPGYPRRCGAFPEGIPQDILHGDAMHFEPVTGDHGIQFQPADDEAAELAASMKARLEARSKR